MRWQIASATAVTGAFALGQHIDGLPPASPVAPGPGPTCELPPRSCRERCDELVELPLSGPGFIDGRIEAESIPATSTSFLRRDLAMLVQYAAAKVACQAASWDTGVGGPIVLGDMSHRDGSTPGTVWNSPRHPPRTHVGGLAIDIAYFQRDAPDNRLRPICRHRDRDGEQWHCVGAPEGLDAWRTALFIGAILEEPSVRVIGVDGRAAGPIRAAFEGLCERRWIDPDACRRDKVRYEMRPGGRGWFYGHHNHLHVAWQ